HDVAHRLHHLPPHRHHLGPLRRVTAHHRHHAHHPAAHHPAAHAATHAAHRTRVSHHLAAHLHHVLRVLGLVVRLGGAGPRSGRLPGTVRRARLLRRHHRA